MIVRTDILRSFLQPPGFPPLRAEFEISVHLLRRDTSPLFGSNDLNRAAAGTCGVPNRSYPSCGEARLSYGAPHLRTRKWGDPESTVPTMMPPRPRAHCN